MRQNLKNLRIKYGLTQYSFADLIGISRSHYRGIESGDRGCTVVTMRKIVKAIKKIDPSSDIDLTKLDEIFFADDGLKMSLRGNPNLRKYPYTPSGKVLIKDRKRKK